MAEKALFITINDLKRKSIIDGNVDADKLIQFIEVAQDTHIQNYLGGKLYNRVASFSNIWMRLMMLVMLSIRI